LSLVIVLLIVLWLVKHRTQTVLQPATSKVVNASLGASAAAADPAQLPEAVKQQVESSLKAGEQRASAAMP